MVKGFALMKKNKIDYEKFLDMDKHQNFLNELYKGRDSAIKALRYLQEIPYQGYIVRRTIKKCKKYIRNINHDIRIEENWRCGE